MNNVIRICERDGQPFEIVIINDNGIHNNGPLGLATTLEGAHKAAIALLPTKQTAGARWQVRSKDGVYSELSL